MNLKQTVHYRRQPDDVVVEGRRALLHDVVDHPSRLVSNKPGTPVITSPVVRIHEGYFETENSFYLPLLG